MEPKSLQIAYIITLHIHIYNLYVQNGNRLVITRRICMESYALCQTAEVRIYGNS